MMYPEVVEPHNQYVILDGNGAKLTAFASDDNPLTYCQQGRYIAYIGEGDIPNISVEEPWIYLSVKPDAPMSMGDIMDIYGPRHASNATRASSRRNR